MRICCLVFARLNSTRVPNKLLQEVGGQTLLDRGLDYLVRLREACPNVTPFVCSPGTDTAIVNGCRDRGIKFAADEVQSSSWPELIKPAIPYLQGHFDWVWDANVFCHPFLRVETGKAIVEYAESLVTPFTVVYEDRGVVWSNGLPVIGSGKLANTKTNPVYQQLAHIAYCYPADEFWLTLDESQLAHNTIPVPLPLHWSELIDIDTPEDLEHARAVASYIDGRTA